MLIKAGKHDEREPRGGTSGAAVTVVPERAGEGARPARGGDSSSGSRDPACRIGCQRKSDGKIDNFRCGGGHVA